MPTIAPYKNPVCPKCQGTMIFLNNLMLSFDMAVSVPPYTHLTQDMGMYVKLCKNCGYSELFSQMIIDDIWSKTDEATCQGDAPNFDPNNAPF